jgi:hypothetical protein
MKIGCDLISALPGHARLGVELVVAPGGFEGQVQLIVADGDGERGRLVLRPADAVRLRDALDELIS